jgi:hypothetical protein
MKIIANLLCRKRYKVQARIKRWLRKVFGGRKKAADTD